MQIRHDASQARRHDRRRTLWLAGVGLLTAAGALLLPLLDGSSLLSEAKAAYRALLAADYLRGPRNLYLNPWNYVMVLVAVLLERWIPAKPSQRIVSTGLVGDFLWFNADCVFRIAWLTLYLTLLHRFYDHHLGFLTVDAVAGWPPIMRLVVSFVVFDFLQWLHHVIRHRVEVFWYFHMVHHSQRQMNLFTEARVHVVEFFVAKTIIFIPTFMLQMDTTSVVWFAFFMDWYSRLYHANLRTNYGILKYVLVTPQSHRIHHSLDPAHQDKNFAVFFTIWDRLFGTLHPNYDEYPETGVVDQHFPLEGMGVGLDVLRTFVQQLLYPFRLTLTRLSRAVV